MSDTYTHVGVKKSTKELLKECKKEYLRHHPELEGKLITNNLILKQVCKYYLDN